MHVYFDNYMYMYVLHVHACSYIHYSIPVGTDVRVVGNLVVVHPPLTLLHEPILLTVGPDARCSQ